VPVQAGGSRCKWCSFGVFASGVGSGDGSVCRHWEYLDTCMLSKITLLGKQNADVNNYRGMYRCRVQKALCVWGGGEMQCVSMLWGEEGVFALVCAAWGLPQSSGVSCC
jgi:hypothetical protein